MSNPISIQSKVLSVIHHDDTVSTITLKPSRRLPNFKPGQFLHLALDPYDPTVGFWPESRVFSIAATPSIKIPPHESHILRLCIVKAVHELQWKPQLDSNDAIDWTVSRYKSWHNKDKDLQRISLRQVHDFSNPRS